MEPLTSDFQPTLGIRQGPSGTSIYLYSLNGQLLNTFSSSREAGEFLKCNHSTIIKYARSNTIFYDQYILSLKELSPKQSSN